MSRQIRKHSRSGIYHILLRGIDKLFRDDEDRGAFINTVYAKSIERDFLVFAYCLMDDHVHLLINTGNDELSRIMKSINVRYVHYFNKKYRRIGPLLQDRFKSEAIDSDTRLLGVIRHIHLNPVKAEAAKNPAGYLWSSYNAYMAEEEFVGGLVDSCPILEMFSLDRKKAIPLFAEYTGQVTCESFMEHQVLTGVEKTIHSEKEAREYIKGFLQEWDRTILALLKDKNLRNRLLRELKAKSSLSVRQIAELFGIDRNIVQRAK